MRAPAQRASLSGRAAGILFFQNDELLIVYQLKVSCSTKPDEAFCALASRVRGMYRDGRVKSRECRNFLQYVRYKVDLSYPADTK